MIAIDIDSENTEILKNKFTGPANFQFLTDDILKYKIENDRQRIVGNLPYNISTQIILKLIDSCEKILDMHFLVQKEVAEKIAGKVGTKSWGKLAIKIAAFFDNEILFCYSFVWEQNEETTSLRDTNTISCFFIEWVF